MNFLESKNLVLFYDGYCNLCSSLTQFVKDIDSKAVIQYAPLQSPEVKEFLASYGIDTNNITTVVCTLEGKIYTKSTAVIKVMQQLPELSLTAGLLLFVPVQIRDSIYELVANNRYQWFGQREKCFIADQSNSNKV